MERPQGGTGHVSEVEKRGMWRGGNPAPVDRSSWLQGFIDRATQAIMLSVVDSVDLCFHNSMAYVL